MSSIRRRNTGRPPRQDGSFEATSGYYFNGVVAMTEVERAREAALLDKDGGKDAKARSFKKRMTSGVGFYDSHLMIGGGLGSEGSSSMEMGPPVGGLGTPGFGMMLSSMQRTKLKNNSAAAAAGMSGLTPELHFLQVNSPGTFGSPSKSGVTGSSPMNFAFGRTPQSTFSHGGSTGNYYATGLTPACTDSPMIYDNGTPLSDIGDMQSIYSAFSPSLFSSPRPNFKTSSSASSPRTEEALTVLADSCIASAEKDYSQSQFTHNNASATNISSDSPNLSRIHRRDEGEVGNVSFTSLDMSALSAQGGSSPLDVTEAHEESDFSTATEHNNSTLETSVISGTATKRKHYTIAADDQESNSIESPLQNAHHLSISGITDRELSTINDSIMSVDESVSEDRSGAVSLKKKKIMQKQPQSDAVVENTRELRHRKVSGTVVGVGGEKDEVMQTAAMQALLQMQHAAQK